jgi:hypothetical protein
MHAVAGILLLLTSLYFLMFSLLLASLLLLATPVLLAFLLFLSSLLLLAFMLLRYISQHQELVYLIISPQMCITLDGKSNDIQFVNGTFLAKPLLGRSSILYLFSLGTHYAETHMERSKLMQIQ